MSKLFIFFVRNVLSCSEYSTVLEHNNLMSELRYFRLGTKAEKNEIPSLVFLGCSESSSVEKSDLNASGRIAFRKTSIKIQKLNQKFSLNNLSSIYITKTGD